VRVLAVAGTPIIDPTDDVGEASRLFVVKLRGSLLSSSSSSSVVSEGVGGGGGCRTEPGEALGGISGGGVALIGVGATTTCGDVFLLLLLLLLLLLHGPQPMISEMKCGVGVLGGLAYTCGCQELTASDAETVPSVGETTPTVAVTPL
jgi:hypothetical protein